jgi:hypothetical protein
MQIQLTVFDSNFQYYKNDNILIEDIPMFSDFLMKSKKTKTIKSKKTTKKSKKSLDLADESGIVLIDDDLEVDTEKELEERKAFLEEARSQDSGD